MARHIVHELRYAAVTADAFATMCPAKARSLDGPFQKLSAALFTQESGQAYILVDAVLGADVIRLLQDHDVPLLPVFPDDAEEDVFRLSPQLAAMSDDALFKQVFTSFWGQSKGLFLIGHKDAATVRDCLGRHVFVELPDGDIQLLRFYDPRVLLRLMDAMTATQRYEFYSGVIDTYLVEDKYADVTVLSFNRDEL